MMARHGPGLGAVGHSEATLHAGVSTPFERTVKTTPITASSVYGEYTIAGVEIVVVPSKAGKTYTVAVDPKALGGYTFDLGLGDLTRNLARIPGRIGATKLRKKQGRDENNDTHCFQNSIE
ncbi:hypothetical protein BG011_000256 [Mortierella polycephala]|uniref:Uncharacterized protein n=1 Tax=Mortierella polycephala TaxID=41804 RepID=A0A9P6PLW6_9FUNG|nr:hypothetical protein BG011_000256 [Mortierella polycephala]